MNYDPQERKNIPTPPTGDGKGMSIAGLVLGILGVIGGFIPVVTYFTAVFAILGLIFGALGMKRSKRAYGSASGLGVAGLVLGIIGTSFAALGLICNLLCLGALYEAGESLNDLSNWL